MLRFTLLTVGLLCSTAFGQFSGSNSNTNGGSSSYGAFGNRTIGGGTQQPQSTFSSNPNTGSAGMNSGGGGGGNNGGTLGQRPGTGFQLGTTAQNAQQRNGQFIGADAS